MSIAAVSEKCSEDLTGGEGSALVVGSCHPGNPPKMITVAAGSDGTRRFFDGGGPTIKGDIMKIPLEVFASFDITRIVFQGCCPIVDAMGARPCLLIKKYRWAQQEIKSIAEGKPPSQLDFPEMSQSTDICCKVLKDLANPREFITKHEKKFAPVNSEVLAQRLDTIVSKTQPSWVFMRHCSQVAQPDQVEDPVKRAQFIEAFRRHHFQLVTEFHPPLRLTESHPGEDLPDPAPENTTKWLPQNGALIFFHPASG